jgi:hypothetical protein
VVAHRRAEIEQRLDDLPTGVVVARVAGHDHAHRLAVAVGWQERQRRRQVEPEERAQLVGCLADELAVERERLAGRADLVEDRAADHRADRVELELERGHYAEVPAAAAQRPEQVRVLRPAGGDEAAVGGDDVGRHLEEIGPGQRPRTNCDHATGGPTEPARVRDPRG